jgi:hypothetical protein
MATIFTPNLVKVCQLGQLAQRALWSHKPTSSLTKESS